MGIVDVVAFERKAVNYKDKSVPFIQDRTKNKYLVTRQYSNKENELIQEFLAKKVETINGN